jgi:hypothetical protein
MLTEISKITELTPSAKPQTKEQKVYEAVFSGISYRINSDRSSYSLVEHKAVPRPSRRIRTFKVLSESPSRWVVQCNAASSIGPCLRVFATTENPTQVTLFIKRYSTTEPISWSITSWTHIKNLEKKYVLGHYLAEKLAELKGPERVEAYREATMAFDIGLFMHELEAKEKKDKLALLEGKNKSVAGKDKLEDEEDWVMVEVNGCSV